MLPRGSNHRGASTEASNRSRGSRGRGASSRGTSSSSSTQPVSMSSNPFERDRADNTVKREQRGRGLGVNGGRGIGRSPLNKQVRFSDSPEHSPEAVSESAVAPSPPSTLDQKQGATPNSATTSTPHTSFLPSSKTLGTSTSPFGGMGGAGENPFGAPSLQKNSDMQSTTQSPNKALSGFGRPSVGAFGAPSGAPLASPFKPPERSDGEPSKFSTLAAKSNNPFAAPSQPNTNSNPFGAPTKQIPKHNPFGAPSQPPLNTFATPVFSSSSPDAAPSHNPSPPSNNPFAAKSPFSSFPPASDSPSCIFGTPSTLQDTGHVTSISSPFSTKPTTSQPTAFGTPTAGIFGTASITSISPFSLKSSTPNSTLGAPYALETSDLKTSPQSLNVGFGAQTKPATEQTFIKPPPPSSLFAPKKRSSLSQVTTASTSLTSNGAETSIASRNEHGGTTSTNGVSRGVPTNQWTRPVPSGTRTPSHGQGSSLGKKLEEHLRKRNIHPPKWPTSNPGDPSQKDVVENFWKTSLKNYRAKVRQSLIQGGYLDDPDKPKKLSEAIDFKGICEDMCPEFEKFTRIMDQSVDGHERERGPDGKMWPSMKKMVKAMARSAAGQEAPLPMDIRTPATLRMTVDYLLCDILEEEEGSLLKAHLFLWDRTRAIRRDFVFQQSGMDASDLKDQVYCLERITRFHVVALHNLSLHHYEEFSEQQEVEQLGKSLISLIQAYEDCAAQKVECDNEAEFRAYYLLFHRYNPNIMETVQDWGIQFWKNPDIQTAVALVEATQNTWDGRGPLKPAAAADVALNGFSRYFDILEDSSVSYTMACFGEIHFNHVRRSILRTILTAYRKQRDQAKDWTLSRLNDYLRFDDEEDVIVFGEACGVTFEENQDNETYLVIDSEATISNASTQKQQHSHILVERKRGDHSLVTAMRMNVFEDLQAPVTQEAETADDENELFVGSATPKFDQPAEPPSEQVKNVVKVPAKSEHVKAAIDLEVQQSPGLASMFSRESIPTGFHSATFPEPTFEWKSLTAVDQIAASAPKYTSPQAPTTASPSQTSIPITAFNPQPQAERVLPTSTTEDLDSLGTPIPEPKAKPNFGGFNFPKPNEPIAANTSPSSSPSAPGLDLLAQPLPNLISPKSTLVTEIQAKPRETTSLFPQVAGKTPNASSVKQHERLFWDKKLSDFTDWYTLGEDGIISQFLENEVEAILRITVKKFQQEEDARIAREELELAVKEADQFRFDHLARKYGQKWREEALRLWQRRRGREARKLRQELAESRVASKRALNESLLEDFKASVRSSRRLDPNEKSKVLIPFARRDSLGSLLDANGASDYDHVDPTPKQQRIQSKDSGRTARPSAGLKVKKKISEERLRRSILSDPAYLSGTSRSLLLPKYSTHEEATRQISGVKSDYFRLKARGITTLPDMIPAASLKGKDLLRSKRSFESSDRTPQNSDIQSIPRSVPERPSTSCGYTLGAAGMEDMKARAQEMMVADQRSRKRASAEIDDQALFARAKRVREQMDEGSRWFREQIDMDSASRSAS